MTTRQNWFAANMNDLLLGLAREGEVWDAEYGANSEGSKWHTVKLHRDIDGLLISLTLREGDYQPGFTAIPGTTRDGTGRTRSLYELLPGSDRSKLTNSPKFGLQNMATPKKLGEAIRRRLVNMLTPLWHHVTEFQEAEKRRINAHADLSAELRELGYHQVNTGSEVWHGKSLPTIRVSQASCDIRLEDTPYLNLSQLTRMIPILAENHRSAT